ncbi:MAG TPA: PHB depolymerase family esterase [Gemmataceae bacterium]|jgi:polyhydroxybutyrate depolymerase|nr:PHB depolymerase family esterase [Gemmataceae bacterium]
MWLIKFLLSWRVRRWTRSLAVGGRQRTYHVHVPRQYDPQTPAPVVLALHGATMTGPLMAWFSGLNQKADEAGFLAVYPNGTGSGFSYTWNGGNCCGSAVRDNVDDVGFIRTVLDDLGQVYRVDPSRVFATGMSNGAVMAHRLASELSDRIAAIGPVAGPMGTETCDPRRPVPVIHFHGTDDQFAPFKGGKGEKSLFGTNFYSVERTIRAWVKANGCQEEPIVEELPDTAKDGTKVTRKTYGSGKDGAEVVLVVIEGGGHTWPGRQPGFELLGKATKNVSANDLMWEFFEKHPMK